MAAHLRRLFHSYEHNYIGKSIKMDELKALTLPNSVKIGFQQIIALAGDFYGLPKQPIIADPSKGQEEDSGRRLGSPAALQRCIQHSGTRTER